MATDLRKSRKHGIIQLFSAIGYCDRKPNRHIIIHWVSFNPKQQTRQTEIIRISHPTHEVLRYDDDLGDDPQTQRIVIDIEFMSDAEVFLSAALEVTLTQPILQSR